LARLCIEEDVARSDQLLVQLGVSEQTVTCYLCYLSDRAARVSFVVQHDVQPFVGRLQNAALDGNSAYGVPRFRSASAG
jgi:hypothetical protein